MRTLARIARELLARDARFLLIGISGANFHAHNAGLVFMTLDSDLFLPPEASNLLRVWEGCEAVGLELWSGSEPLDRPRDLDLARRVIEFRALTQATDGADLRLDLSLVMQGFGFDEVWEARQTFAVDGVAIPVARLLHIVESKAATGRPKDQLFLATHEDALRQLMPEGPSFL